MKKIYVIIVVLFCIAAKGFTQNYYWIGSVNGSWNVASNWSATSGGPAAADYPHLSTDNVILNANATISLNTSVDLNSISISGSSTSVKIIGTGGSSQERKITGYSSNPASPALSIASGCKLESDAASSTSFIFLFANNAQATINGDWTFSGDINTNALAYFLFQAIGFSTKLNVNTGGSITIGTNAYIDPNENTGNTYLVFNAGAALNLMSNGPIIPEGDYNASSNINITGVTDASVTFEEMGSVGNISYNCPSQSNGANPLYLSLLTFTVKGNVDIINTNNQELALISYTATSGLPSRDATIKGNLNIQGNSKVAVAHNDGPELPNNLYVEGNVIANGTSLSIQTSAFISQEPTILHIKGNIQHTAGTLGALSTIVNQTKDLFVIEMDGSSPQTISSHSATLDNANNQVTLRINNSAGVTLLTSLQTGRIDFNTTNKGILKTNSNILTINNTTPASVTGIVVNLPSNPSLGFVDGNLRRRTASAEPFVLPAGSGSSYRGVTLIPSSNTLSTFEAVFVNSDYGGTYTSPVRGIANYYWNIARIGAGANAMVQLSIPGAIPGALTGHDLTVSRYDGSNWISTMGPTGLMVSPGTSTSGTVRSETQTAFGSFTIAYESASALPTYLISFNAEKADKEAVEVKWKITDNSTPAKFDVLRSVDGISFHTIGSISGSEPERSYSFRDNSILNGNNYYRLKMYDRDGSVTFSAIIIVSNVAQGITIQSMMPSMVRDRATLSINSSVKGNMQLVITDINGRVLQNEIVFLNSGGQDVWVNASRLPPGMYQVTGYAAGQKTTTIRFIKL